MLVLVLLLAAPYLLGLAPFRNLVLGAVFADLNGTVTAERTSLGWFSPPAFYGIAVRPPEGPTLLSIDALEGDRPLWRMLWEPTNLGQFRIESPRVDVVATSSGSNAQTVLALQTSDNDEPRRESAAIPNLSVGVRLEGALFTYQGSEDARGWSLGEMNLSAGLRRSTTGMPDVVVDRGVMLDRAAITPAMCDDFLKYIAPVLAGVTQANGAVSLEVDDGWIPLSDLSAGKISGRLSVHAVNVGPGPMVRLLVYLFNIPGEVALAEESIVDFQLQDSRVYHENLEFGPPLLRIRTSGSVGLDQTLDLVAEVELPQFEVSAEERPVLASLSGQTVRVPIGGTLSQPVLGAGIATGEGTSLAAEVLRSLFSEDSLLSDVLERMRQRRQERIEAGEPLFPRLRRDGRRERPLINRMLEGGRRLLEAPEASGEPL